MRKESDANFGDKMKAAAEMVKKFAGATPAEQKSKLIPLGVELLTVCHGCFHTSTAVGKGDLYIAANYPDAAAIMKEMKRANRLLWRTLVRAFPI